MSSPPNSANAGPASKLPPTAPAHIIDDKTPHCIPFIISLLPSAPTTKPFVIGLNGIQGSGKTTLVSSLAKTLQEQGLETLVLSIDDLYLRHEDQVALAAANPLNPLVQHRGEPGTHDIPLATSLFSSLAKGEEVAIPQYDKSAFSGAGDRVLAAEWKIVNAAGAPKIQVVIFEGWCVGFRSLPLEKVVERQKEPSVTLHRHRLQDLQFVNEKLREYEGITDTFDAFIHIDAEDTGFVYEWRLEQERALRREKGRGMSDEMVRRFVDGYMPGYELWGEGVRGGVLKEGKGEGKQLRLVVGRDRRVREVVRF